MTLVVGTVRGLFVAEDPGAPKPVAELHDRSVLHLSRVGEAIYAGTERGLHRSFDRGRSWEPLGLEAQQVWDLAAAPGDARTLYAATQPAALWRSRDGGRTWSEIESLRRTPGADRWCVPLTPPEPGRARSIALDPTDEARWWVGVEVGGLLRTDDAGQGWTCLLPGQPPEVPVNPDIHVAVLHPARPDVVFATTGYGRMDQSEPRERRSAGLFVSEDSGKSWRYAWTGLEPRYTRPMCIDPRPPHALTVGASPTTYSSHRDPGGARTMLYRSDDAGRTWRSLGDAVHSPSPTNFFGLTPDPERAGGVYLGTDLGEVWRVTASGGWTCLVRGLPDVQAVCAVAD
jgi:hypothetical protein